MDGQKIIYENGNPLSGEILLTSGLGGEFVSRAGLRTSPQAPKGKKAKVALSIFANLLLIFSLTGLSLIFGPILFKEISYRFFQKPQPEVRLHFSDILNSSEVQASFRAPDPDFSLVIPKISAFAKIFPNVSPSDENEYSPVLKKGVAHARGTAFPGQKGNIYLFAHSTDLEINIAHYNAVFLQSGET